MIRLDSYPVQEVLDILLEDKSTGKNIIWATEAYHALGNNFFAASQIDVRLLNETGGLKIQPRTCKALEQQTERTRKSAEVFTPAWVCNEMNNRCDEAWFGYRDVFNCQKGKTWIPVEGPIKFPENKKWQDYVDACRLEITCGEAPYLVSRYDASTGEPILVTQRIGLLDRKLRIVSENTVNMQQWVKWALRGLQSVYGYEYYGDSLLIARVNLLMSFVEYAEERWQRKPDIHTLQKAADIISWNIWQMDGLTGTVPIGTVSSSIFDWREGRAKLFLDVAKI